MRRWKYFPVSEVCRITECFSFSVSHRSGRLPWLKHPGFMVVFFDLDFGALWLETLSFLPLWQEWITTSKSSLHSGSWKTFPQALKTQFCWINWTKGEELAHPTVWVLDHVLFLLLPEEYSHSDLLPLVFVTSKVGDTSPSKEAVLHSLENCSSCLCLAYFGLWIPKRTKMPLQKSYLCCHICPFPIHSPGIPAEYSWKGELQYYAEPRCNRLHDQQHSPVRREKVLPYHAWKCLKKDIEFLNFWFKMRAGV